MRSPTGFGPRTVGFTRSVRRRRRFPRPREPSQVKPSRSDRALDLQVTSTLPAAGLCTSLRCVDRFSILEVREPYADSLLPAGHGRLRPLVLPRPPSRLRHRQARLPPSLGLSRRPRNVRSAFLSPLAVFPSTLGLTRTFLPAALSSGSAGAYPSSASARLCARVRALRDGRARSKRLELCRPSQSDAPPPRRRFGFNGGSALGMNLRAVQACMTTTIAASMGGVTWTVLD